MDFMNTLYTIKLTTHMVKHIITCYIDILYIVYVVFSVTHYNSKLDFNSLNSDQFNR